MIRLNLDVDASWREYILMATFVALMVKYYIERFL